jgi:hypothetical protein
MKLSIHKCETCHGDGEILNGWTGIDPTREILRPKFIDCQDCNGTGCVIKEE